MEKWIALQRIGDHRGGLVIAEAKKNIPFEIKRVYCLHGLNIEPRGFHAHKKLQQVMVCLSGSCSILLDDGEKKIVTNLSSKSDGLFIDKMMWREMYDFSDDCVLMVLASDWYDEKDYIRNYDVFLNSLQMKSQVLA